MSKLTYTTTAALLEAYPVKTIKKMLQNMSITEAVDQIKRQNDTSDIIFGRFCDKDDYSKLATMDGEVLAHVKHIQEHGTGLYDVGIKELQPQDNLMQVLSDARNSLSPSSAMKCSYEWDAYLLQKMPQELAMIDKVYRSSLTVFDYAKLITHPVLSRITSKTRQPVLIQKGVLAAVEKAQALAPRLTRDWMESTCKHHEGFFATPYDQYARQYYSAANNLLNALSICVVTDEETLRSLAKLLHRFEVGIVNALTTNSEESTLEEATAAMNVSAITQMQWTIKAELEEAERLAQEQAEQEAKEAAERAEREAKFKGELAREQRLLTLTAKVQDSSITFDEFEEYKQLKAA
ncbi:hypothetical protein [Vibrio europaeus]|uniref:hypothetical protein n=1 Tax=Vibrio europaeus TaxID=300876 RepID=UPI00233F55A5|nr:hypothetical protein [Vibrio europaeus]MDC5853483.1 hypothetical protein [Vibrio europaeus]